MKKMSLKIKLTLKYTGCTFSVVCVALILAAIFNGNESPAVGKTALIVLPLVLIGSFLAGYFLVQEIMKRTEGAVESAAEICRSGDFSRRLDLDESDEADEELNTFLYQLNSMLDEAESAIRRESDFAEDVAKELWMPVSVILTRSAWCLDDWRLSERQRWQIELIQKKAQIVSDLLQEITFLAKADQGFQPADKERLNVSELTKRTVEELTEQFKKKNRTIQVESEIEPEIYAEVDESCYTRMLYNLMENSVEYGREKILIKVVVERAGSNFVCKVADAGIGISENDLSHVWERFYRGDPLRASEGHFGLGLPIVQWIAQVHGGWTEAESILGSGSCFTVGMPCEPKPGEVNVEAEETKATGEEEAGTAGESVEEPGAETMKKSGGLPEEQVLKTAGSFVKELMEETAEETSEDMDGEVTGEPADEAVESAEVLDETIVMPVITDEKPTLGMRMKSILSKIEEVLQLDDDEEDEEEEEGSEEEESEEESSVEEGSEEEGGGDEAEDNK